MTKICNMFVTLYICKKIVKTVFINKKDKKIRLLSCLVFIPWKLAKVS